MVQSDSNCCTCADLCSIRCCHLLIGHFDRTLEAGHHGIAPLPHPAPPEGCSKRGQQYHCQGGICCKPANHLKQWHTLCRVVC